MAGQRAPQVDGLQREIVRTPDEVAAMLRLWEGAGLEDAADRGRVRLQPEHGHALRRARRGGAAEGGAPAARAGCASNAARTANWRALCASTAPSHPQGQPARLWRTQARQALGKRPLD